MTDRDGFDEFVIARSPRLLRSARLLARDWAAAVGATSNADFAAVQPHGDVLRGGVGEHVGQGP